MTRIPPEPEPARRIDLGIEEPPLVREFLLDRLKIRANGHITREALLDGAVVREAVSVEGRSAPAATTSAGVTPAEVEDENLD